MSWQLQGLHTFSLDALRIAQRACRDNRLAVLQLPCVRHSSSSVSAAAASNRLSVAAPVRCLASTSAQNNIVTPWAPLSHRFVMWHGQLMMGESIPSADFHQLVMDSIAEQNFRYITELLFQLEHSSTARDGLSESTSLVALVQSLSELWRPAELQEVAAAVLHCHLALSHDCMRELLQALGRTLPQSAVTHMLAERAYIDGMQDAFECVLSAATHEHGVDFTQAAVDSALSSPVPVMRGVELVMQPPADAGELFRPLAAATRVLSPQGAFQLLSACALLPTGDLPHTVATYIVGCASNDEELQKFLGSSQGLQDFHFQYVKALLASGDLPGTVASFEGLLDVIQAADTGTVTQLSDSDAESGSDSETAWWRSTDPQLPPVQVLGTSVLNAAVSSATEAAAAASSDEATRAACDEALGSAVQLAHVLMRRCRVGPSHGSLLGMLRLLYVNQRYSDMTLLVNSIPQEQVSTGAVLTGHMNLLLRSALAEKGLPAVKAVVQLMESLGGSVAPDSMTWSFLADACIREGDQDGAQTALGHLSGGSSGSPGRLASLQVRLRLQAGEYQAAKGSREGEEMLQAALATLVQAACDATAATDRAEAAAAQQEVLWEGYVSDGAMSDSDGSSGWSSGGDSRSSLLPRSLRSVLKSTAVPRRGDIDAAPFNQIMAEALQVHSGGVLSAAFDAMLQCGVLPGPDTLASLLKVLTASAQDRSLNSGERLQRTLQVALPTLSRLLGAGLAAEDAVALADSTVGTIKRSAGRANAYAVFTTLHSAGLFGEHLRRSHALDELLPSVSIVDVRHVSPAVRGLFVQQLLWELALETATSGKGSSMQGRSLHFRVGWHSDSDFSRHSDWLRKELRATMKLAAPRAEWLQATQHSLVLQWAHLQPWLSAAATLIKQCKVTAISSEALGALAGTKRLPGSSNSTRLSNNARNGAAARVASPERSNKAWGEAAGASTGSSRSASSNSSSPLSNTPPDSGTRQPSAGILSPTTSSTQQAKRTVLGVTVSSH